MGINGLASHLKNNFRLGQVVTLESLHSRVLVIDGNSMLYFISQSTDFLLLDYYTLAELVTGFLRNLNAFECIIVFDGSLPEYKLQERISRLNDNITQITNLLNTISIGKEHPILKILPPFATTVCLDCCLKMKNIKVIVACEEADPLVAKLANLHNGIVLSQDSDYFVTVVPGYCPFDDIDFSDEQIKLKIYTNEIFSKALGISISRFNIFAVVCESDYWQKYEYQMFLKEFCRLAVGSRNIWGHLASIVKNVGTIDDVKRRVSIKWHAKLDDIYSNLVEKSSTCHQASIDLSGLHFMGSNENVVKLEKISRLMHRSINLKIAEIGLKREFWCRPFIASSNVWDITVSLRQEIYNRIDRGIITEYYPKFTGMQSRITEPPKSMSQTQTYQTNAITSKEIYLIAVQYLVKNSPKRICNNHIVAFCAYFVKLSSNTKPIVSRITSDLIVLFSQLQSVIYCYSILLPMEVDCEQRSFYQLLQAPNFYFCMMQAKRGASPKSLVGKELGLFKQLYSELMNDIHTFVDNVIDYGSEI